MHSARLLLPMLILAAVGPSLADCDRAAAFAPSGPGPGSSPRIRAYDARSAALLVNGLRRSATLRSLVDHLEAGTLIVYVQMQPALRGRLSGTLTWVASTTHYRYVRISLNPDLIEDAAISTLGHELQHAVEVANEPSVIDDASLATFYRKTGHSVTSQENGWDTVAAREAGDAVRRDLASARAMRAVDASR